MARFAGGFAILFKLTVMNVFVTGGASGGRAGKLARFRRRWQPMAFHTSHLFMFVFERINRMVFHRKVAWLKCRQRVAQDTLRIFFDELSFVNIFMTELAAFFWAILARSVRVGIAGLK